MIYTLLVVMYHTYNASAFELLICKLNGSSALGLLEVTNNVYLGRTHIFTTVACTKHNMGKLTIKERRREGEVVTFIYRPRITLYLCHYLYYV